MGDAADWELDRMEDVYAMLGVPHPDAIRPDFVGTNLIPHISPSRKDTDMKSQAQIERELRDIEAAEATLIARRAALIGEREKRAALPSEPDRGTVIKFLVQHAEGGIVYTYIAFRSNRQGASWHTTSKSRPGPYTWDDMLNIMQSDVSVRSGARSLEFFQYKDKGEWVR